MVGVNFYDTQAVGGIIRLTLRLYMFLHHAVLYFDCPPSTGGEANN